MLKKLFATFVICFTLTGAALAAEGIQIVASVGDDAITSEDLVTRTKLIIISSGMKGDEETARKIAPQILQALITERLQLQDAARQNIVISDEEIAKAISTIEQQNKMPADELKTVLGKAGVNYSTLQQQVKGQIAWAKIRSKKIQPKIIVSDEEVADYFKTQRLNPTRLEYHVNEIVLTVENTKDQPKALELANKLVSELQNGKGNFGKIATQFSGSASAPNGGDVGWLAENQIPKELLSEIKRVGTGKVIGPVKSVEGYFILFIPETRMADNNIEQRLVTLRQFEAPFKVGKSTAGEVTKIKSLNDASKACVDPAGYAKLKGVLLKDYGQVGLKMLQPAMRNVVANLETGDFSEPVNTGASLMSFLVCEKVDNLGDPNSDEEKNKAREALGKRKSDLEARTYLRNLRRDTNIDIKI